MTEPHYLLIRDDDPVRLRRRTRDAGQASHVSRSYADPFGVVAWGDAPLGVDIVQPVDDPRFDIDDPSFRELILSTDDIAILSPSSNVSAWDIWSSKEAAAKAFGDPLGYIPSHHLSPALWPEGRWGKWCVRRLGDLPNSLTGWMVYDNATSR
ncbi:MAG: 4'-phosphopantetheinyl transferase superfamily protein [Acidobacteria bacterium]|nr:4'-phosphopantetheinyl transferase superfamily protein [Acidobacteriota bacterium]